jgi:hypothetical protein
MVVKVKEKGNMFLYNLFQISQTYYPQKWGFWPENKSHRGGGFFCMANVRTFHFLSENWTETEQFLAWISRVKCDNL